MGSIFSKVAFPIMCSGMIWAISVPMQTAILGHLSADAIAANSVSSTFFQYLKVIVIAISSASAVVIGKDIGEGDIERVKSDGRTLSVIDVLIGIVLASLLFVLRGPLLSMYKLTDTAKSIGKSFYYDHECCYGGNVLSDAGIGRCNSRWWRYQILYVYEYDLYLGESLCRFLFLRHLYGNFRWNWLWLQCSQIQLFKGIPVFLRFRSYKWIHKLT